MFKFYAFLLLIALSCQTASGQIYLCGKTIQRVNPATWETELVCTLQNQVELFDIGLGPGGEIFGIGSADGSGAHILYAIDSLSGNSVQLADFQENFNGMATSEDGLLYLAGARLFTFQPASGQIEDMGPINYNCAGDLEFWGDSLLMTAATGHLVLLNLSAPHESTPLLRLDEAYTGLAAYPNCITGKRDLFAFFGGGKVIQIEIAKQHFEAVTPKNLPAAGAASALSFAVPPEALLDTIVLTEPACGDSTGAISIRLKATAQTAHEFSLDGLQWKTSGDFDQLSPGVYRIHLRNRCSSARLTIHLERRWTDIHCAPLPTAFTPNHDGVNDTFGPIDLDPSIAYLLTIYNRWGEKIFQSCQERWTGQNADGLEAPAEVYGYLIRQDHPDGRKSIRKGAVTLIR